jgi:hypothetical protein
MDAAKENKEEPIKQGDEMRSSRVVRASMAVNAKVATVLGSIPGFFDTVESEGRQMKLCRTTYVKKEKMSSKNEKKIKSMQSSEKSE